ncbi:Major facilitator superfamily [Macrophomina phaseolina MS6]|uniref:Major facilitator superfamily n=1 Tax=Macrophomina phaseolina (strain MS6) TaxID=1126212 RepID=K2S437_MACPH|nr:Major facilitator superfamily [Macrophomina phaseolina MS6]
MALEESNKDVPGFVIDSTDASEDAQPSMADPQPAPDGGFRAWTQVFMGHLVLINGWGYLSSFGLFQSYYTTSLSATPSAISWIGSVQIFLVYFVGAFSGRALDVGYYYIILALGSFLQVLGVFMTSISTEYWQLFLSQGICKGLGDGLVFCPTVSLVATYFSKKRSLAMACTASGGATGGIIFPLVAQQLLPKVGFGWTVRTMAFVILFNAAIVLAIARVRLPPRKTGPLVEWAAFKELSYTLFCIGMFFNLWAVYLAYFYVSFTPPPGTAAQTDESSDQHICEEHNTRIRVGVADIASGNECGWHTGTAGVRAHG